MELPAEFAEEIEAACKSQGLDSGAVLAAIDELVLDDEYIASTVWAGPAWSQEDVKLDVYVLGKIAIYNYAVYSGEDVVKTVASATFLDALTTVWLTTVGDERSPYVLMFQVGEQVGRAFGGSDDKEGLEAFRRALMKGIIEVQRGRKG